MFFHHSSEYFYEFIGVRRCWDVVHLHRLMWSCVALNIVGIFLGIVTAAILGAFRELVRGMISFVMYNRIVLILF